MNQSQLETLMGAYYHQDFDSIWGAFDEYLEDCSTDELSSLIVETAALLDLEPREDGLQRSLESMGNSADLSDQPGGYRGWLEEIVRRGLLHLGD